MHSINSTSVIQIVCLIHVGLIQTKGLQGFMYWGLYFTLSKWRRKVD